MTRRDSTSDSSAPPSLSRCQKPTQILAAWPQDAPPAPSSVKEVPLEDILESSLLLSLQAVHNTHANRIEEEREQQKERAQMEAGRRRRDAYRARIEALTLQRRQEAQEREEFLRNREELARERARVQGSEIKTQMLKESEQRLALQSRERTCELASQEGKTAHQKRRLQRMSIWGVAAVALLSVATGIGVNHSGQDSERKLSALSTQSKNLRAQAEARMTRLQDRLTQVSEFETEEKQRLLSELEAVHVELARLQDEEVARRDTTSPPRRPTRRLATQKVAPSQATPPVGHSASSSSAQIASAPTDISVASDSCDEGDPLCFDL